MGHQGRKEVFASRFRRAGHNRLQLCSLFTQILKFAVETVTVFVQGLVSLCQFTRQFGDLTA
ncbi:MAG: hypothetical protein HP490_11675 [Nitrospira sp.]|nr:hypothetical protein [Nitrospira sp.]